MDSRRRRRWAAPASSSARPARRPRAGTCRTSPRSMAGWRRRPMADLDLWPIGNCQVSALVDGAAGLAWACQPRVDGDPLFCSLLEPAGESPLPRGEWRISVENQVAAEQSYLRNTPILATRLTDADGGVAEIFDFCPRF